MGFRTETKSYEAALSAEYNFASPPFNEKYFPFLHVGFGIGNINLRREARTTTGQQLNEQFAEQRGRSKIIFMGAGIKKVFPIGVGIKAHLDYLVKKDFLQVETIASNSERERKGAQLSFGLFYQFR